MARCQDEPERVVTEKFDEYYDAEAEADLFRVVLLIYGFAALLTVLSLCLASTS